jgi:aminopeptidase N
MSMLLKLPFVVLFFAVTVFSQVPAIEPGVSQELAKWRAAHYSDVRYKLNLTLEKMSPVLKGTMEIRVGVRTLLSASAQGAEIPPIILDWRRIKGHEAKSIISNVVINGTAVSPPSGDADRSVRAPFEETNEHLIFRDGVVIGENVIKLDFTSPILTSGAGVTRYVDREDGAEYIYSLFVPSDASTAFPVFDQPDLKARFSLTLATPDTWRPDGTTLPDSRVNWKRISNTSGKDSLDTAFTGSSSKDIPSTTFEETKPISTYVFAFAAGPFERVSEPPASAGGQSGGPSNWPAANAAGSDRTSIYVRRSQAEKFKSHTAEVFRLNREGYQVFRRVFRLQVPVS